MTINQYDFSGKKAIVRVDFNVPLQDGKITDDTRIRGALPTLKLILEKGGALIIMSQSPWAKSTTTKPPTRITSNWEPNAAPNNKSNTTTSRK